MCCNFPKAARERRVVLERGGLVQPPSLLTNYLEADIPGGLAEFGFDPHAPTLIIWEGNTIVPASREHHAPWQDILDLAYYSGWRKNEILGPHLGRNRRGRRRHPALARSLEDVGGADSPDLATDC